MKKLQDIILL